MFGKQFFHTAVARSSENELDRRRFLRSASAAGLGVVGAGLLHNVAGSPALAADGPSDAAILNFALNLEYLEAEFYSYAVTGHGLPDSETTGKGNRGGVIGGRKVPFMSKGLRSQANEIMADERHHVQFLRAALGSAKVSRPEIDIKNSFTAAAQASGLIGAGETFDPYANENNFLLAAFIFEDVGVTAYKGAAPLINNKTYLEAAAGLLAVEAYHASNIRTNCYERGLGPATVKISNARDSLDGTGDKDQGVVRPNIVPTDRNGLAYSRTTGQVLNIVYLTPTSTTSGGFFPDGVNGPLNKSS